MLRSVSLLVNDPEVAIVASGASGMAITETLTSGNKAELADAGQEVN